ncbi:MAG: SdpI family protein [Burkholderiales bacterium]|nr:SdpI family protein [Burkholderiales bacterium]
MTPNLLAVLWLVIGLPLVTGLIPRNRFYGFRTWRTMADDAHWSRINRLCGILFSLIGTAELGALQAFPSAFVPFDPPLLFMPIVVACLVLFILDMRLYKGDGQHG